MPATTPALRPLRSRRARRLPGAAARGRRPVAPLAAAFERKLKTTVLTGQEDIAYDAAPDLDAPRGSFAAFVCRACGFTEWYASDPERIPIGPAHGTDVVVVERTPYR